MKFESIQKPKDPPFPHPVGPLRKYMYWWLVETWWGAIGLGITLVVGTTLYPLDHDIAYITWAIVGSMVGFFVLIAAVLYVIEKNDERATRQRTRKRSVL